MAAVSESALDNKADIPSTSQTAEWKIDHETNTIYIVRI